MRLPAAVPMLCAVPFFLTTANAQATLADVSAKTAPGRIAELAWSAVTTSCPRGGFPTPSVFFVGTESELYPTTGKVRRIWRVAVEFRATGSPSLQSSKLSEASRLNGVQYEGVSRLPVGSFRYFIERKGLEASPNNNSWSEWSEPEDHAPEFRLQLQNGQWSVKFVSDSSPANYGYQIPSFSTPNLIGANFVSGFQYQMNSDGTYTSSAYDPVKLTRNSGAFASVLVRLPCSQLTSANPIAEK
jgi:hypothetical protein